MSTVYNAWFADARTTLAAIRQMKSHRFLPDATRADSLPALTNSKDVTDARAGLLTAFEGRGSCLRASFPGGTERAKHRDK
ncbi:MAG: hypothetical protein MUC91_13845 [Verrucomicrobia bacterium]|nr:hypothetical protein [Verrucomicrobiota bacterium]